MVVGQEAMDRSWNMGKSDEIQENAFSNIGVVRHWIRYTEHLQSLQFWRCSELIGQGPEQHALTGPGLSRELD